MVLLALIGLACSITAQYFAAKAAVGFSTKVRYALFSHIQKLSFSEMDTIGTSTLITRMTSDINQTQSGVNMVLRLFLRSPFIVFGAMIMAFTVDVKAALIFVVTIPLLSVVVFSVMLVSIPLFKKVQWADQFHSLKICTVQLRHHRLNLCAVQHSHHNGLDDIVKVVSKRDLITS
mgnify:CR=1 FL=1